MNNQSNNCKVLGMLDIQGSIDVARRVYDINFVSPCITAHANDTVPKIVVKNYER